MFAALLLSFQAPAPKVPDHRFSAAVQAPICDERNNTYNVWANGGFDSVRDPILIRITLRETLLKGKGSTLIEAPLVTEQNPAPESQHTGIMRPKDKPREGSYLAGVFAPRYDPETHKYELKIEYVNDAGKAIHTYKEKDSEWIPVPKPKS